MSSDEFFSVFEHLSSRIQMTQIEECQGANYFCFRHYTSRSKNKQNRSIMFRTRVLNNPKNPTPSKSSMNSQIAQMVKFDRQIHEDRRKIDQQKEAEDQKSTAKLRWKIQHPEEQQQFISEFIDFHRTFSQLPRNFFHFHLKFPRILLTTISVFDSRPFPRQLARSDVTLNRSSFPNCCRGGPATSPNCSRSERSSKLIAFVFR
jgi:hypothetical protein